jgi:ribulose-phosphate 3-epimerase
MEVLPSVFATDEEEYVERYEIAASICKKIHVDVMDGMFVKNKSPPLSVLRKMPGVKIEVHLMVRDPLQYVSTVEHLGAKKVYFHIENYKDRKQLLQDIFTFKESGIKAGIAVSPKTDIADVKDYLDSCDSILIMSIEPGKEGQTFLENTLDKIDKLRKMTKKEIGVDGGINRELLEILDKRGVDFAVVGSAIFSNKK